MLCAPCALEPDRVPYELHFGFKVWKRVGTEQTRRECKALVEDI